MTPIEKFTKKFKALDVLDIPDHGVPTIGPSRLEFKNPLNWFDPDKKPPLNPNMNLKDYLKLVVGYQDPYPIKVIDHDGVMVVRDDLLPDNLGSKIRYVDAFMSTVSQQYIFYAAVAQGHALKVLAVSAKKYGKTVIAIAPLRKTPTPTHVEAIENGVLMMYYQSGGMSGVRKRCRDFITEFMPASGLYIPAGVKHPLIIAGFAKTCWGINKRYKPDTVFSAASTMTMNSGIQLGFPTAEIHAIQVAGNAASIKWPGRAIIHIHDQPFDESCKEEYLPPFNSIKTYDAKAWIYAKEYKQAHPKKRVMFWNVAGQN